MYLNYYDLLSETGINYYFWHKANIIFFPKILQINKKNLFDVVPKVKNRFVINNKKAHISLWLDKYIWHCLQKGV